MGNSPDGKEYELMCIIVSFGLGSKVIKFAKQFGIKGGTIFLGIGTIKNSLLQFLELTEIRKEIILMAGEKSTAYAVMDELNKKFEFKKPNHGIAFSTSIMNILGTHNCTCIINKESKGVENSMYNIIFIIVDKGKAEAAIEAATKAGSKGGTIINARGSGIHETSKLFSMEIEPEKEIVLIISDTNHTESITSSIRDSLEMDKPGNGIIIVQNANKTYGLY